MARLFAAKAERRHAMTHDSAREVIARALSHRRPSAPEKAADILSALQSAGYAVVPVEPSKLMISVGEDTLEENTESNWDSGSDGESHNTYTYFRSGHVRAVYRAMLLAAEEKNDARK